MDDSCVLQLKIITVFSLISFLLSPRITQLGAHLRVCAKRADRSLRIRRGLMLLMCTLGRVFGKQFFSSPSFIPSLAPAFLSTWFALLQGGEAFFFNAAGGKRTDENCQSQMGA